MIRVFTLAVCAAFLAAAQTVPESGVGKRLFVARCAGCHGEDGNGGGHGPAIVNRDRPRASSLEAVRTVILHGIAGAGMPAFSMPDGEASAIAGYVMALKVVPAHANASAPGDPAAGERFYTEKGNCANCHMIRGVGGVLGPDLSHLARNRTPAQIERALRDPGGPPDPADEKSDDERRRVPKQRAVRVKLRDGRVMRGVAKNESPFDLQLLGTDQQLHLLVSRDIAEVVPEKSLMPKTQATREEMQDLVAYLSRLDSDPVAPIAEHSDASGVPFASVARPPHGSWPTYNGNVSGNRFSALDQINTTNVERLAPRWMFAMERAPRSLQTTPVVVEGVMYVTSVNEAHALDARNGREIWRFNRPRSAGLAGDAASGINRGVAVLGNRVFMVTDNAHLLALDRRTGQLVWDATMADSRQNYGSTGAPLVVNDLVIAGVSGGDEGVRGFLDAYKASTGDRVWRFWTIPAPGEPGSETWQGRAIEHGCATTWLTGTYDPETGLLYWPTGNPCPDYNGDERNGDNLYSSSVLALEPATGKLKWFYQFTPHDLHDWDAVQTPVLVDAPFHGETRKLLMQANRNGFFYVLDRVTGKVLLAQPFVKKLTWASGIGPDGRPQLLPGNEPTEEGAMVCPSVAGAANWPSPAYNPATGSFYMFAEESCDIYSKNGQWWKAGESFYGGATRLAPGARGGKFLKAIDIQTGKTKWEIPNIGGGILGSGVMSTAGGLIFYGDGDGAFNAASAQDGKPLWRFNTGQAFRNGPMTYMVDGKQYVAAATGLSIVVFALP
jgi:alcohol dehydrogenase (cytochrome c)